MEPHVQIGPPSIESRVGRKAPATAELFVEERHDERPLQSKRNARIGEHAHRDMSFPRHTYRALHTRAAKLPLERDQGVVHDELLRLGVLGPGERAGQFAAHRHVESPQDIGRGGERRIRGQSLELLFLKHTLHGSERFADDRSGAGNARMERARRQDKKKHAGAHTAVDCNLQNTAGALE